MQGDGYGPEPTESPSLPYNLKARVERLEIVVCILARGILLHEYSKDLCRGGIEEALRKLAYDENLKTAISAVNDRGTRATDL